LPGTSPLVRNIHLDTWHILRWGEVFGGLTAIANAVGKRQFKPAGIVGIEKGGTPIARILGKWMQIPVSPIYHSYEPRPDLARNIPRPRRFRRLEGTENLGLLLVDDICDSGQTLHNSVVEIRALGFTKILTAVLVRKRHDDQTNTSIDFKPDLYAYESDISVKFPWDLKLRDAKMPKLVKFHHE
jgi:hypoxanthine phosphoribosyltransferase